ncbi:NDR1/HIN1-like protein 6 [Cynara cardunculus var. scolymus]|uniref:NDR1/HIN1-like protein 6 n=1 Tax=Cynara cardunculus var. scolymus TaxID=59895 RepID=UPI000D62926D|nr:NDR1/HIN1-like protein 6 [Cynara cardunculus var. scolymus]
MSGGYEEKGSGACLRCICCCYCLLFLLIAIVTFVAYHFYTVEKPKPPTYNLQSFSVKNLDLQSDNSLTTEFSVEVKTRNPNKDIGFIYGADNKVSVLYNDVVISSGKLPEFKQDPKNTTVVKISLEGTSPNEPGSLQDDVIGSKDNDGIPLVVNVEVPMKVFVGKVELMKEFMAYVSCDLVVDNLAKGKTIKVVKNECEPDVEFFRDKN